jgi:anti-sigma regulatory factor (Ser/Thr protein kinase)
VIDGEEVDPAAMGRGDERSLELRLPHGQSSAWAARRAVDDLRHGLGQELLENIRLLVSELVTNSIRHAHVGESAWIHLRVEVREDRVRVEVTDPGPGFDPVEPLPSIYQDSGWGLYLVGQISDRWGVDREGVTRVWFEIDRLASLSPPSG